ncbi:NusG-like protein [Myxococcus xanthus DK 1622]|uniref:NusG-like protein n=2 Tax=Myxococcus xanthus TaxID=34 RepID=Q1D5E3_MYXXD|nr:MULTISPECIES: transcription termination/antitermination NusG family protein [Myxococcus]ABF91060.1 NusG-like protein [Myxococcus xanthus DK 1622]QZZ51640.1 Transcription antitermination protein RfaH [Myxococcus xanthus]UYI11385.1 NusG-like protein [Myxococcus xanthus]UYI18755.1 NusG-like protein [Myxococcus xanthus]CAA09920.1 NusG-like protein [Myxococcus xanthus]
MPGPRCAENDWVALLVRVNHEKVAAAQLGKHGYEFFLPTYTPPKSSGVKAKLPLFPGYLFCRYQPLNPYRIVRAPGVIRLLGGDAGPEAVPAQELEAIRRVADSGVSSNPCDYLRVGQRVRIIEGPLTGLEGSLVTSKSQLRFIVSVGLLQRSVSVEVSAEQLEPITD